MASTTVTTAGSEAGPSGPMIRGTALVFHTGTAGSLTGSSGLQSPPETPSGPEPETSPQRNTGIPLPPVFQDALRSRDIEAQRRREARRSNREIRRTRDPGDTKRKGIRRNSGTEAPSLSKGIAPSSSTETQPLSQGIVLSSNTETQPLSKGMAPSSSTEVQPLSKGIAPGNSTGPRSRVPRLVQAAEAAAASAEIAAMHARADPATAEADPAPAAVGDAAAELRRLPIFDV